MTKPGDRVPPLIPVAWRYMPSDFWRGYVYVEDEATVRLAVEYGRSVTPLYNEEQLRAYLASLRADVERKRLALIEAKFYVVQSAPCAAADCRADQSTLKAEALAAIDAAMKEPQAPAKKQRGRPALPPEEAQTALIRERVTEAERLKYDRLGGKGWLRAALRRARET